MEREARVSGQGTSPARSGSTHASHWMPPMRATLLRPATLLIGTLWLTAAAAQAPGWTRYTNPQTGTEVDFPAGLFSRPVGRSANGSGAAFRTPDGHAQLSIYALPGRSTGSPAAYLRKNLKVPRSALLYQRITGSFFAVSGVHGDQIYYGRCNLAATRGGTFHCIELVYPRAQKRAYDPIVTRVSLSLRPLSRGHAEAD